ncbi:MAG: ABC transporter permease [Gallionellales bacterium GWA2_59_43]|nr:MAG: ABC transporter permease [Gallionellales bacterium GWA2_59_43]
MRERRQSNRYANFKLTKWLVSGPPLLFLLLLVAAPGAITVLASFRYPGEFGGLAPLVAADPQTLQGVTLETYRFFFGDFIYAEVFVKSLFMALVTTLICLLMAYPLALLIAHSPKKSRNPMVLLVVLPFTSNFLIGIYAWMIILGPQSALSQMLNGMLHLFGIAPVQLLFSPFAVLVALVYAHLPFMALPLYTNLEKHDPALLDAAQDLGANAWQRFWRVTFPLSQPGIFAGSALVFIPVLGMFAIPELLGGTGDMLVGNLIKEQFLGTRDWPFGSTLSILLTVAVLLIVWLAARLAGRGGRYA